MGEKYTSGYLIRTLNSLDNFQRQNLSEYEHLKGIVALAAVWKQVKSSEQLWFPSPDNIAVFNFLDRVLGKAFFIDPKIPAEVDFYFKSVNELRLDLAELIEQFMNEDPDGDPEDLESHRPTVGDLEDLEELRQDEARANYISDLTKNWTTGKGSAGDFWFPPHHGWDKRFWHPGKR